MKPLPWLASVALAARCAELLEPSLDVLWHDAPERERNLFQSAIREATQTARTGVGTDKVKTIADEITKLVGRFELHLNGLPVELTRMPDSLTTLDDARIRTIRDIIDVAARAARSADAMDGPGAFTECQDGVNWSFSVTDDLETSELANEISRTVELLYDCCGTDDVNDDSKVWWTGAQWRTEN